MVKLSTNKIDDPGILYRIDFHVPRLAVEFVSALASQYQERTFCEMLLFILGVKTVMTLALVIFCCNINEIKNHSTYVSFMSVVVLVNIVIAYF